jgi:hypothetical protein
MIVASEALVAATIARLKAVTALAGVHEDAPIQASRPYATVAAGPEVDWSHKTGLGREVRLAVTVRDAGERPERLRRLMAAVETEMADLETTAGWTIVTATFLRSRIVATDKAGWAGVLDYRMRMLATP